MCIVSMYLYICFWRLSEFWNILELSTATVRMLWNDLDHCLKKISLIEYEDDILSNPKKIQVYLPWLWAKLINQLCYIVYTLYSLQCTECTVYNVHTDQTNCWKSVQLYCIHIQYSLTALPRGSSFSSQAGPGMYSVCRLGTKKYKLNRVRWKLANIQECKNAEVDH